MNTDVLSSTLETCIFAYLGMAIFSLKHNFKPAFVAWSIVCKVYTLIDGFHQTLWESRCGLNVRKC